MTEPEDLAKALGTTRVRFWMCINRDHKRVVWHDDVAHCQDCGLTSKMTARYQEIVRESERERIARQFRDRADQYEQARQAPGLVLGQIWDGTKQAMTLRHHADWIEGKAEAP